MLCRMERNPMYGNRKVIACKLKNGKYLLFWYQPYERIEEILNYFDIEYCCYDDRDDFYLSGKKSIKTKNDNIIYFYTIYGDNKKFYTLFYGRALEKVFKDYNIKYEVRENNAKG